VKQHDDPELRQFIRAYQRRVLRVGKKRAVAEVEAARSGQFRALAERLPAV
jgi:hypothetical protein